MNILKTIKKALWNEWSQGFVSWAYGTFGRKSHYQLLQEFTNLAYICITTIAEEVAKYNPYLATIDDDGKEKINRKHPFIRLMNNPNPNMSKSDFYEALAIYKELVGEWFVFVTVGEFTRRPKEFTPLRPDKVKIAIDETNGKVIGYTFRRDDGTEIPIELDEMIHSKSFDPLNAYRGYGPVQAGNLYLDTDNSVSLFQRNFMKNQATPSGVLSFTKKIDKEPFEKLKKEWQERQAGLDNAGKTLLINGAGAEFAKMGLSISDINMGDVKGTTSEQVRELFRVPKALLGETDSSGLGRGNVEAIEYVFCKRVIDPKLTSNDDAFTLALHRYFPETKDAYIRHDSQVPQDKEFELQEQKDGVDKWLTRNDIRAAKGLPPVEGGDKLYVGFNQIELSDKPKEENTSKHIGYTHAARKDAAEQSFFRLTTQIEDKTIVEYEKKLKGLLVTQENKVKELIRNTFKGVNKQNVSLTGTDFTMTFTEEEVRVDLLTALLDAIFASGVAAIDFLNPPDIEFVLEQATRDAIFDSSKRLLQSFNQQTALKIQKQLAAGLAEGESVDQLTKRVESIYEEARGFRARRIANTEAHKATNAGTVEGYRQSGVKKIQWIARPDACEFCAAMNGEIIDIGKAFIPRGGSIQGVDGGQYLVEYDDIRYADAHPNCRCKIRAIIQR